MRPKGPLHGGSCVDGHITLGDGLGPTEHVQEGIEDLVNGVVSYHFLGNGDLLAERGEETSAPQICTEGAQTRTPCVENARLRHGALLWQRGDILLLSL